MHREASWLQYAIPIVIAAIVIGLRIRALGRPRRLRLETMWILPAIFLFVTGYLFWSDPPGVGGWLATLIGLGIGGAVGWQRGRLMAIDVDPETHALSQRGSPAALLVLFALIVVRMGLRTAAAHAPAGWHVGATTVTLGLTGLAFGLISATRLEMFLRARRLLRSARGLPA